VAWSGETAGRLRQAISCYKKALTDREHTLGTPPGHHRRPAALRHTCQKAGKIPAALQLHEETCAGYERVLGAARADLARTYQAAGRLTDAATLLRSTLTRCEQALQPGHPLTQCGSFGRTMRSGF
jgi:hypothetical protein